MSLSRRIALGLAAGIATGIVLGELAAGVGLVADAYVRLLQMTVLPYVAVSLVAGIGSLGRDQAVRMLTRVGAVLLALWGLTLVLAFAMPLSYPHWDTASFFSAPAEPREAFGLLDLYIPTNPFSSLANNVVPAVVLFSGVLGAALIGVEGKAPLLDALHAVRGGIGRMNQFVMQLAPYGLFAVGANLAGTLRVEELARIQIYLLAYGAVALLLLLWVLPGLVAALAPVRYRDVLSLGQDALVTAFMTGSLFAVLPTLGECARELLRRGGAPDTAQELPDVIVSASFSFPHAAKVLTLSFVPFAAWFSETPLGVPDHVRLAGVGIVSFFASLNAAVPYLLDLFRIPQDTFQLFLATGTINSRIGSAVAAMHTLALALLGSCAMSGILRLDGRRLARYALLTLLLVAGSLAGLRVLFQNAIAHPYSKDKVLAGMERLEPGVDAVVHRTPQPAPAEAAPGAAVLDLARQRGRLRVGYQIDDPPYSFFNARGDLVGLAVELAHRMARDLGLGLEFVPVTFTDLEAHVAAGDCDLVMTGIVPERAAHLVLSTPWTDETLAFVVADHDRARFATRASVRGMRGLRLGVPALPGIPERIREFAPEATQVLLHTGPELLAFFEGRAPGFDALVMTGERGSVWSLRYPQLAPVVPEPPIATVPVAYAIGRGDLRFKGFVDAWLEIQRRDGTIRELKDYWVYGKNAEPHRPRWSVVRDVLGWVE